jgi:hypothetical protein
MEPPGPPRRALLGANPDPAAPIDLLSPWQSQEVREDAIFGCHTDDIGLRGHDYARMLVRGHFATGHRNQLFRVDLTG